MSDFVLGPNQTKWLEALESGKYDQGRSYLKATYEDGTCKFCCLGVWSEISGLESETRGICDGGISELTWFKKGDSNCAYTLPDKAHLDIGLRDNVGTFDGTYEILGHRYHDLTELNDNAKLPFAEIAKIIREEPDLVFQESK